MKEWTIGILLKEENGYIKSTVLVEADSIPNAYEEARRVFHGRNVKFGAILEGKYACVGIL